MAEAVAAACGTLEFVREGGDDGEGHGGDGQFVGGWLPAAALEAVTSVVWAMAELPSLELQLPLPVHAVEQRQKAYPAAALGIHAAAPADAAVVEPLRRRRRRLHLQLLSRVFVSVAGSAFSGLMLALGGLATSLSSSRLEAFQRYLVVLVPGTDILPLPIVSKP